MIMVQKENDTVKKRARKCFGRMLWLLVPENDTVEAAHNVPFWVKIAALMGFAYFVWLAYIKSPSAENHGILQAAACGLLQ